MPIRLDYQNKVAALREQPGVLGSLFGPSDTQLLQLLASEVGGEYHEPKLFEGERVDVAYGGWRLTFDYVVPGKYTCTRVRCSFVSLDNFKLRASPNNFINRWLRLPFAWPMMRTGIPLIDDSLLLCGTNASKLREVFADHDVLTCLSAQPPGWIDFATILDRSAKKTDVTMFQLQVTLHTRVKHAGHLRQLLQFSAVLLDHLASIGSAQPLGAEAVNTFHRPA